MIELIVAPFCAGAPTKGVELGGVKIRELCRDFNFYDGGECIVTPLYADSFYERMRNKNTVIDSCLHLGRMVKEALLRGNTPIVLGGDHSLSLGSIPPVNACYENLGVIYLDAHGDINTDKTTLTGNIHGMTLAATMGIGHSDLVDVVLTCGKVIKSENVFFIGTRSLDPGERKLINDTGMHLFDHKRIKKEGIGGLSEWLANHIDRGITNLHFSIDIDVLDPELSPGTGVKEENGMKLDEFFAILNLVLRTGLVCSIDLVEYNPLLDINNKSLNICRRIVEILFKSNI